MPFVSGAPGGLPGVTLTGTPANGKEIVATSATAAAWSTVSSPGFVQLATLTADGTSSVFDFTAVSGSYSHLRLYVYGRSDLNTSTDLVYVRFNNDSGANYDWQDIRGTNSLAAASTFQAADTNGIFLGTITALTGTANLATIITADIPYYTATTFFRCLNSTQMEQHGVTAATANQFFSSGTWHNAANAISQVTVRLGSAHFVSGSGATLYGVL